MGGPTRRGRNIFFDLAAVAPSSPIATAGAFLQAVPHAAPILHWIWGKSAGLYSSKGLELGYGWQ